MKILSLFDGMACGHIAFQLAGIPIDRYVAYEIDKYAIKTAMHNFPDIEECGDVFNADFAQYEGFDFLVGGSPCTYWSIAQTKNRETEASGMGWELFSQYVRALREAKPKYFIYENNKSMSKEIRASIDKAFGFEAVCINSALVSAQNRQRLYWVGRRNADGTYSKVNVEQPEDRGILLRDILETGESWLDKAYAYTTRCQGATPKNTIEKHQHTMCAEPIKQLTEKELLYLTRSEMNQRFINNADNDKSHCVTANFSKGVPYNVCVERVTPYNGTSAKYLLKNLKALDDKSVTLTATCYKGIGADGTTKIAEPVCMRYERTDGKTNTVSTVQKDNMCACPVRVGTYPNNAKDPTHDSKQYRIYDIDAKSTTLCGQGGGMGAKTGLYAIPVVFENGVPTKAISAADGKTYDVYRVKDGNITIKGKSYPIKLIDGYYIIRKLTVRECMRLQQVPEWYDFSCVFATQAYKMLGNGWSCEIIKHLINATQTDINIEMPLTLEQGSFFEGVVV